MKKIVAGNWKMNLNVSDSVALVNKIIDLTPSDSNTEPIIEVIIAPSYLSIDSVSKVLKEKKSNIKLAVQDIHWQKEGAYTGKICVTMLSGLEVKYSLVGHSEQRLYFNETDEKINQKLKELLKHNIKPILCIGETLEEREQDRFKEIIITQLKVACDGLSSLEVKKLIIAYEPVWAIGTGKIPSMEQINEVHEIIKKELETLSQTREDLNFVLYGGSVKPENCAEIMQLKNVDGVLVGGSSLKSKDFSQIISASF